MSYQQERFKEIADAIREKTGSTESIKPSEFASKQAEVYDAGKQNNAEEFWNSFMSSARGSGFIYIFAGKGWNDNTFNPLTDIVCGQQNIIGMFTYSGIRDLKGIMERNNVSLNLSKGMNASNLFAYSYVTHIPKLILTSATNFSSGFSNCTDLISIEELSIPNVSTASSAFSNCTSLEEIRISGQLGVSIDFGACPLSKESVESIVSALSDTSADLTVTFSKTAVNNAFTTEEWNALIATKSNWTFALA